MRCFFHREFVVSRAARRPIRAVSTERAPAHALAVNEKLSTASFNGGPSSDQSLSSALPKQEKTAGTGAPSAPGTLPRSVTALVRRMSSLTPLWR